MHVQIFLLYYYNIYLVTRTLASPSSFVANTAPTYLRYIYICVKVKHSQRMNKYLLFINGNRQRLKRNV